MIPLALVTGFLGTGKTTLLRQLVTRYAQRRVAYLVNEFAPSDVDGRLLDLPPDRLVSVVGGSIFCRCLVSEFIRHLHKLASLPGRAPAGVVIEASGMSDPRVIRRMLTETQLDRKFALRSVVAVVSPDSFADLLETLPALTAQVAASDVVLVNKADLHTAAECAEVEAAVRAIQPAARVLCCTRADVDLDVFSPEALHAPNSNSAGDYAPCTDPHFARSICTGARATDEASLFATLTALRPLVYRVKGFVRVGALQYYADVSRAGVECHLTGGADSAEDHGEEALVAIYAPASGEAVRAMLAQVTSVERV